MIQVERDLRTQDVHEGKQNDSEELTCSSSSSASSSSSQFDFASDSSSSAAAASLLATSGLSSSARPLAQTGSKPAMMFVGADLDTSGDGAFLKSFLIGLFLFFHFSFSLLSSFDSVSAYSVVLLQIFFVELSTTRLCSFLIFAFSFSVLYLHSLLEFCCGSKSFLLFVIDFSELRID